jgi:hypothetical protein
VPWGETTEVLLLMTMRDGSDYDGDSVEMMMIVLASTGPTGARITVQRVLRYSFAMRIQKQDHSLKKMTMTTTTERDQLYKLPTLGLFLYVLGRLGADFEFGAINRSANDLSRIYL